MTKFNPKEYWENRLTQEFSLQGVGRIDMGRNYNNWLYRVRRKVFIASIRSLRKDFADADILDIGSGTGFYIERWEELGCSKITGLDLTEVVVKQLKNKYPQHTFEQLDISDKLTEKVRDWQFDIISGFDVLFHIVDDDRYYKAFENIYSMLATDGIFIFSDLFLHGETKRSTHIVHRSLKKIDHILSDVGFQVLDRRPMFVLMNAPWDSNSKVLKKFWQMLTKAVQRSDLAGQIVGSTLYPIELALVSAFKESPAAEIMICKKS